MILFLDTEDYSEVPIKNGTYVYAENCEVMIITYAFDDGEVQAWDATLDPAMPEDLRYAIEDTDCLIVAHNAMFDRNVLRLSKNIKIKVDIRRWRCSMVKALAHSLPGGLDKLCEIFQLSEDEAKIKEGKQLVQLFCKPRPKNSGLRRATRVTHPQEWKRFIEYAKSDITSMRIIWHKIPEWNYRGQELEYYFLDQKINDRGFLIDRELAEKAIEAVEVAQASLKKETQELTGYDSSSGTGVESTSKRDQLLCYLLEAHGVELPNLQKDTLERRLNDPELSDSVKELLRIRLQVSTTSTSKYKALLRGVSSDGRMRGTIQFVGAGRTGRAAGRTFQPQNLPRPDMETEDIDFAIDVLKVSAAELFYDNVMKVTSNTIRGCIVAPADKVMPVADLANIEGRGLAWEAQEDWALQAYREYDTCKGVDGVWYSGEKIRDHALTGRPLALEKDAKGEYIRKGPDAYKLAYARAFDIPYEDVTKEQRKIGKVLELFMGYQGGVGAFITGAETYGIDLDEMADAAYASIPPAVYSEARSYLDWAIKKKISTFGLSEKTFCVCDALKRLWRESRPKTVQLWEDIENGVRVAIRSPGKTFTVGRFKLRYENAWLRIQLPSGRALCYPSARVEEGERGQISYMGINQYNRKWCRLKTFGGKLVENITQAIARDLLYYGMLGAEDAGYEIILSVHDENLSEAFISSGLSHEGLAGHMALNPKWAEGLPLAAAGFTAKRYRKD